MLEDVYLSKFLGIRLDQGLVWDDHINSIFSKLTSGVCVLRILSKYLPTQILSMAYYYDLIYPHLSTLTEVSLWGARYLSSQLFHLELAFKVPFLVHNEIKKKYYFM